MVRIFRNSGKGGNGEFVIQTTCLDADTYLFELAEALSGAMDKIAADDRETSILSILQNAMPLSYKLSGYKADGVSEQRTLVCGSVSPESCEHIFSVRLDAK